MYKNRFFTVLSIAGFDGSCGAGIQADLKTFSALGCYGTTALTALPIQNTRGVRAVFDISASCVEEQIKAILDDIPINTVKIGMLHRQDIIESVVKILRSYPIPNIVLDPVMLAKSGDPLLMPNAIEAMRDLLFPIATVLTPNLLEASELLKRDIRSKDQMEEAALELIEMGPQAVVVKGGHLNGSCDDCLALKRVGVAIQWLYSERINTKNTHGTGCTFSAAIASYLARGLPIIDSVRFAKNYLTRSIEAGAKMQIGQGNGPVHHFHHLWKFLHFTSI